MHLLHLTLQRAKLPFKAPFFQNGQLKGQIGPCKGLVKLTTYLFCSFPTW